MATGRGRMQKGSEMGRRQGKWSGGKRKWRKGTDGKAGKGRGGGRGKRRGRKDRGERKGEICTLTKMENDNPVHFFGCFVFAYILK
jgi:hypothetical protein